MTRSTPAKRESASSQRVAVFDIDGTIFRSSLLIEITQALVAAEVMPPAVLRASQTAERRWRDRQGPYSEYIQAVVRSFTRHLAGVPEADFLRVARQVVRQQQRHTYRYTRDLVEQLRQRNYFLLAISHSPKEIVDPFCRRWGFDKVYGQLFAVDRRGRYTGETLFDNLIDQKGLVLQRAQEKEGFTLRGSIGVGDTEPDVSFLELVERPICFNPNQGLYQVAKRRGWEVVVERKDMIYSIHK